MPPNPDQDYLIWALGQYRDDKRALRYRLCRNYYNGDHQLTFATDKFRQVFGRFFTALADNLCASVVDIQAERLEVIGFGTSAAETKMETLSNGTLFPRIEDPLGSTAWDLWERNDMDIRSDQVHKDSLKFGDGYVIVWPDNEGFATIWPQEPESMAVKYSAGNPGHLEAASKLWLEGAGNSRRIRVNVYLPDRIDQWVSTAPVQSLTNEALDWEKFQTGAPSVENPYGRVPVFHFPNRVSHRYGLSELLDVIPLQDALNKAICDMIVAMEFQAFRQRYVTGWEPDADPVTGQPAQGQTGHGAERLMTFADEKVRVGEFGETNLQGFLAAQSQFRAEIARVSGIPLNYFFVQTSEAPSGEALKTGEIRFSRKNKTQRRKLGKQWEEVVKFALEVDGKSVPPRLDFNALWENATPRSETEFMDVMTKKQALGVPPSQILAEMGYDPDEVKRFLEEVASRAPAAAPVDRVDNTVVPDQEQVLANEPTP